MIEQLIKSLKGVLPPQVWDYIFETLGPRTLKLKGDPQGVQVSPNYVLIRVNLKDQ